MIFVAAFFIYVWGGDWRMIHGAEKVQDLAGIQEFARDLRKSPFHSGSAGQDRHWIESRVIPFFVMVRCLYLEWTLDSAGKVVSFTHRIVYDSI